VVDVEVLQAFLYDEVRG